MPVATLILGAFGLFTGLATLAFLIYFSKACVDAFQALNHRLTTLEGSYRELLQLSSALSSTIVQAIEARQDFKDREGQLLSHHQNLINRLADLADPKRIPPGMRPATPDELARLKERNEEAQEKMAGPGGPGWPGFERDTRPEVSDGLKMRLMRKPKKGAGTVAEALEPEKPQNTTLPVSPTPSSSGVSL